MHARVHAATDTARHCHSHMCMPCCVACRYVVAKDMELNSVFVSRQYFTQDKQRNAFSAGPFNWLSGMLPDPSKPLYCKVRHGPTLYRCHMELEPGGMLGHVTLDRNDQGLAPGQYAVFYQEGLCLGAAKIVDAPSAKVSLDAHKQAAAAAAVTAPPSQHSA